MDLDSLIALAQANGGSDLHLEAGLPAAIRVRGTLKTLGEPLAPALLMEMAKNAMTADQWQQFLERRSADFSKNVHGIRVRINVLQTSRGVGFAIRLLTAFQATIERLNLHPDLKKLVEAHNGLILVSGATGSGKSSTLAALIQEINTTETRHILTIESPIEFVFKPRNSYIRQREVGRDTPSFEQALIDSLREDPDVMMVGEMRDPETMRLTLSASETGHLVLATVHSSTCAEALQRVVSAFPAEIQSGVAAQLADSLVAVITQRLKFRPEIGIRVPELEILVATHAIKNFIRNRDFFKIASAVETGADHGMWSFNRYRKWLDQRKNWVLPDQNTEPAETDSSEKAVTPGPLRPTPTLKPLPTEPGLSPAPSSAGTVTSRPTSGRIEIEPVETEFGKILKRPGE